MLRPVFSCLLLAAVLSTSDALAQQSRTKSAKKPADSWGAEPAPAAPTAAPAGTAAPAAADGFAAPAAPSNADLVPQSNGFAIAPGFTAAPSHRVRMDYRGRPLAPYVKRNVSVNTAATAPAPMVEAAAPAPAVTTTEVAAPVAAPAAKSTATGATATKKVSSAGATAPAAAKKAAPAKKAPAKKSDDGWGSSGSGW